MDQLLASSWPRRRRRAAASNVHLHPRLPLDQQLPRANMLSSSTTRDCTSSMTAESSRRDLSFFDGSVVSRASVNFAPKLLHARPSRVAIDRALHRPQGARLPRPSFWCAPLSAGAARRHLCGCLLPGELRMPRAPASAVATTTRRPPCSRRTSRNDHGCVLRRVLRRAGLLERLQPGLAGEGTVSLLAARPPSVRDGSSRALAPPGAGSS